MKDLKLKLVVAGVLVMAFFGMLGVVGDYDWSEQVVLHMSYEEYDWVKDTLTKLKGSEPSERDIAHWWAEHRGEKP